MYLVGSALTRPDYRDVDIRIMLTDDTFAALAAIVHPEVLAIGLSLWGQRATGLPVDCQVQAMTAANAKHDGTRHAVGLQVDPRDADGT